MHINFKSIFLLVFIFPLQLSLFSQQESYYLKITSHDFIERTEHVLKSNPNAKQVYRPFKNIAFDGLDLVFRFDAEESDLGEIITGVHIKHIEYLEKVPIASFSYTPNDLKVELGSPNQWYHYKINAREAWDYFKGSENIVVAIVDNGFLTDHPDLQEKIIVNTAEIPGDGIDNDSNGFIDDYEGWNALGNNGDVYIVSSNSDHGTHVAGIAAAHTDNNIGMASIGFKTKWLPVKVANSSDVVTHGFEGISFAASRGADIINCSWGTLDSSATGKSVIEFALNQGCYIVSSAGNFANEVPVYPATYAGVISVAATTQSDAKLNISSFGTRINISAPGSGIWSTSKSEVAAPAYAFKSGTSMASPLVAGLLALMKGYTPDAEREVILNCLYSTATDIDNLPANAAYDSLLGTGRINVELVMKCLYDYYNLSVNPNEYPETGSIFPNPVTDFFEVKLPAEFTLAEWNLFDVTGKKIMTGKESRGNLLSLSQGIYIIELKTLDGSFLSVQKLIKN